MEIENLDTYTEVDPNSTISKTSTKVTFTDLERDVDAYLYKDFGIDQFNGFNVDFTFCITGYDGEGASVVGGTTYLHSALASFSNNVDDAHNWSEYITVLNSWRANYSRRVILNSDTDTSVDNYVSISLGTTYYATLVRDAGGDTVSLYVYSDAARTSLVGSTSCSIGSGRKFRYFYPIAALNFGDKGLASGYVEAISGMTIGGGGAIMF